MAHVADRLDEQLDNLFRLPWTLYRSSQPLIAWTRERPWVLVFLGVFLVPGFGEFLLRLGPFIFGSVFAYFGAKLLKRSGLLEGYSPVDVAEEIWGDASAENRARREENEKRLQAKLIAAGIRNPEQPAEMTTDAQPAPVALTGSAAILAKIRSQRDASARAAPRRVAFLYASQTGTAREIARLLGSEADERGIKNTVAAFNDVDVGALAATKYPVVVFVASSTGDGDPPDNAANFWTALRKRTLSSDKLAGVRFCSLGLGDSNYTRFLNVPRALRERFVELGATPFYRHGEADEVEGIDDTVDAWIEGLWEPLKAAVAGQEAPAAAPKAAPAKEEKAPAEDGDVGGVDNFAWTCPASVELQGVPAAPAVAVRVRDVPASEVPERPTDAELRHVDEEGKYSAERPFYARIAESSVLTTAAAEARREGTPEWRRVLAVALDIEGSHATFAPGDAVAVRAENDPRDVAGLLSRLGLKGDRAVALSGVDGAPAPSHLPTPATVGELFTRNIDFTSPARKTVLAGLAGACGDAGEARTLRFMASRGGRDHYRVQVLEARASLLDLLERFPSCRPSLELLLTLLPPLAPRMYSVANSPHARPGAIEVALSVVQFDSPYSAGRRGVASNWLDRVRLEESTRVPIYIRPGGSFGVPSDLSRPWVMVGPGTGVAPFRGFLQERRARLQESKGRGTEAGEAWLYFGCRSRSEDYLYGPDLESFAKDGTLTSLRVAFSREDPKKKVYVQHLMAQDAARLRELVVERQAYVFVCGDGAKMARDVHGCLVEILVGHSSLGDEAKAGKYLAGMTREGRYVRDIWS